MQTNITPANPGGVPKKAPICFLPQIMSWIGEAGFPYPDTQIGFQLPCLTPPRPQHPLNPHLPTPRTRLRTQPLFLKKCSFIPSLPRTLRLSSTHSHTSPHSLHPPIHSLPLSPCSFLPPSFPTFPPSSFPPFPAYLHQLM